MSLEPIIAESTPAEIVRALPSYTREKNGWWQVSPADLSQWNARLLQTDASLYQYPYWNEAFRIMHFSPRYLVFHSQNQPSAFVCILTIGLPGLKIGLVHRGPIALASGVSDEALKRLAEWSRAAGYAFLRFTHSDGSYLDRIASLGNSERRDAFPFYHDLSEELIVEQAEDDVKMLANFQPIARRKIKKATSVGYEVSATDSPESFKSVWSLFQKLSDRKGFRYRPLASYLELIRRARSHQCVRLYVASLKGSPLGAILILRDRTNAVYMSGALDTAALEDRESPACLLHWTAMRDLYRAGVKYYSLGTRSGTVYQFKRQFHPYERVIPPPVILMLNRNRYRLWCATVYRISPLWSRVKRLLFK